MAAAPDEATVDAALCRRLSRGYRSSDHGAAWRVSASHDALLAQGRIAGLRPPAVEDHETAAEDLVRLPADPAGFLPRRLAAQADRRRARTHGAALREARHRGPERRARFGAGPHETQKSLAWPLAAASNCFSGVERGSGARRPLTPTLTSESFFDAGRRQGGCEVRHHAARDEGKQSDSRQRRACRLCRAKVLLERERLGLRATRVSMIPAQTHLRLSRSLRKESRPCPALNAPEFEKAPKFTTAGRRIFP